MAKAKVKAKAKIQPSAVAEAKIKVGTKNPAVRQPTTQKIRGVLGTYIYGKTKYEKGKVYIVPEGIGAYLLSLRDTEKGRPYFELADKPKVIPRIKRVASPEKTKNRGNRTLPKQEEIVVVDEGPLNTHKFTPNVDWEDEEFEDEGEEGEEEGVDEEAIEVTA